MSRYEKGKTKLDFTEARDSEWQWHQLGHMQVCISLQTDNHAITQVFYRPDALPVGFVELCAKILHDGRYRRRSYVHKFW